MRPELFASAHTPVRGRNRHAPNAAGRNRCAPAPPSASRSHAHALLAVPLCAAYPPENVTQQLTRSSASDGRDTIHALVRGRFAPGQRSLSLHVAFCPPLAATPHVQVRQLQGATVQVKVAQVMPYGTRIDVRLGSFSQQSENVLIELHASERPAAGGASPLFPSACNRPSVGRHKK